MPRTPRVEVAGGIHHVTARGNRQQTIFRDESDRSFFVREIGAVAEAHAWIPLAYCLMSNHVHLVIETPVKTLGLGMQQLAGNHAQRFNRRHGKGGRLFQGRYGSVLVRSDEHFAQLLRYVALNPVAAGLCRKPTQWRWSNHRDLLAGVAPASTRVETRLEQWGGVRGTRYERLFEPDHPLGEPAASRPSLQELLSIGPLDDAMQVASEQGYAFAHIAAEVGLHPTTVARRIARAARAR